MTGPDSALTQAAWCHAHQLLSALLCHKSPAGGNESLSVRAGCTSWHRHHLTSRSPCRHWSGWNQEKWGMEADGAIPPRSLISLLWASSTLSSSEVKGHTKYISECHLRGGGGEKEKKWSPPVSSQIYVELNWQTVLVFLNPELWETAGGTAACGKSQGCVRGIALCSLQFNGVILLKVMTQPYWDFHSAFRCS